MLMKNHYYRKTFSKSVSSCSRSVLEVFSIAVPIVCSRIHLSYAWLRCHDIFMAFHRFCVIVDFGLSSVQNELSGLSIPNFSHDFSISWILRVRFGSVMNDNNAWDNFLILAQEFFEFIFFWEFWHFKSIIKSQLQVFQNFILKL